MISWRYEWSKKGPEPQVVRDQGTSDSHAKITADVVNILDKMGVGDTFTFRAAKTHDIGRVVDTEDQRFATLRDLQDKVRSVARAMMKDGVSRDELLRLGVSEETLREPLTMSQLRESRRLCGMSFKYRPADRAECSVLIRANGSFGWLGDKYRSLDEVEERVLEWYNE